MAFPGAAPLLQKVAVVRYGNPASAGLAPHQQPFHELAAEYRCSLQLQLSGALQAGAVSAPTYALSVRMPEGGLSLSLSCFGSTVQHHHAGRQYDIPAFLLKSAPAPADVSERRALGGFVSQLYRHWRQGQIARFVPASLVDWSELLPESVLEMLKALQQEGVAEQDLIAAFLAVLGDITRQQGCEAKLCRWLAKQAPPDSRALQARISDRLTELTGWALTRGFWPHQRVQHAAQCP